jgi:protein SDA1
MATRAVAEAEARGEAAPKVRKNGILSLSELKRRAKAAAKTRRAAEAAEAEENAVVSDSEEDLVEHTRVLDPEDFRRIKALQTKGKLDDAMDKSGARKAKETAAEEMRRMLRLADRSTVADRRVNPDALMAVGLRKAHDKETRVASIMAGREDRGEFGSSQERKNKKTGGTTNVEKKKRKNMPLAARVMAAGRRRRGGAKFGAAKAVKDKQFKGKFRKGAN